MYYLLIFVVALSAFYLGFEAPEISNTTWAASLFILLSYASYIDIKTFEIPDLVSIGLFPLGALWCATHASSYLYENLAGSCATLVALSLFNSLYRRVREQDGIGFGDIKLLASSVLWIGIAALPATLLIAATSGIVASLIGISKKGRQQIAQPIPFGPHLSLGIWITWIVGTQSLTDIIAHSRELFS
ncbi:A24 family peptidase [uncultured Roseibium sp.]|uniref:prepilin peptidase n=1 Tax=uncultured Roseibium sp. TaxID=1936171 RepID=UPI003216CF35